MREEEIKGLVKSFMESNGKQDCKTEKYVEIYRINLTDKDLESMDLSHITKKEFLEAIMEDDNDIDLINVKFKEE